MAVLPILSKYTVLIDYVGAPRPGIHFGQRFNGIMSVNFDTTAVVITIPHQDNPIVFNYDNLSDCERDWEIIERQAI
jgi:hypothetical protein